MSPCWRQSFRRRRRHLMLAAGTCPTLGWVRLIWRTPLWVYWLIMICPAGGWAMIAFICTPSQLLSSTSHQTATNRRLYATVVRVKKHRDVRVYFCVWCTYKSSRNDSELETHYLYSLAVVHFDYMEVETVYSFAWRDEVTSLLIKIPPNVHQDLKEKQARQKRKEGRTPLTALLSRSVVWLESLFTELLRHETFIARTCWQTMNIRHPQKHNIATVSKQKCKQQSTYFFFYFILHFNFQGKKEISEASVPIYVYSRVC